MTEHLDAQLREVASHHYWLGGEADIKRYITFWTNWKGDQQRYFDSGYADDWARRFSRQDEYAFSDYDRIAMLLQIDGEQAGRMRLYKSLLHAGWKPDAAAVRTDKDINGGLTVLDAPGRSLPARRRTSRSRRYVDAATPAEIADAAEWIKGAVFGEGEYAAMARGVGGEAYDHFPGIYEPGTYTIPMPIRKAAKERLIEIYTRRFGKDRVPELLKKDRVPESLRAKPVVKRKAPVKRCACKRP